MLKVSRVRLLPSKSSHCFFIISASSSVRYQGFLLISAVWLSSTSFASKTEPIPLIVNESDADFRAFLMGINSLNEDFIKSLEQNLNEVMKL